MSSINGLQMVLRSAYTLHVHSQRVAILCKKKRMRVINYYYMWHQTDIISLKTCLNGINDLLSIKKNMLEYAHTELSKHLQKPCFENISKTRATPRQKARNQKHARYIPLLARQTQWFIPLVNAYPAEIVFTTKSTLSQRSSNVLTAACWDHQCWRVDLRPET